MRSISNRIGGIVGPTLMAMAGTEAANMDAFSAQIPPVVYLNGTLLFVAGLSIVRSHNRWVAGWTILVTLTGWIALALGLIRMMFPASPQADGTLSTYVMLAGLFFVGLVISASVYGPITRNRLWG